jgi:hypothetical protein
MEADGKQKVEHIARLHEIEQDRLTIKCRCNLENCVQVACAVMGRIFCQPFRIANVESVSMSNTVAKMLNEFQFRRMVEVIVGLQRITNCKQ